MRTLTFPARGVCTILAMTEAMPKEKVGKKENEMPESRRTTESTPVHREPAEPPPYWWRRAEDNRQTMSLSLVVEEPEPLDARELLEDETWPKGKLPLNDHS